MIGKIDIETLADLVACRARVDKTEPDPKNLRAGWRTDQLLADIDAYVIGQENDPASYAEIMRRAHAQLKADGNISPEVMALILIAIFRGERLLPVTPERYKLLDQQQGMLADIITGLPEGTRNERCCSLFEYHRGVYYDAYGRFDLAADAQKRAAERADGFGDVPGAAICRFVGAVYQFKQTMIEGNLTAINAVFSILEERFAKLVEATRGTAMEVQWGQGNGPYHMIQACVWLDRRHPEWDSWVTTVLAAAEKLGQAWEPAAQFVRAVYLDKYGKQAGCALQAVADDVSQVNEVRATARLILARRALEVDDPIWAGTLLIRMPKQGAQHVRAIATRLLQ